jgi:hypothetical protein
MKISRNRTEDFFLQNEGSIFLLHPFTYAAQEWITGNISPDRMMFGDARRGGTQIHLGPDRGHSR